MNDNMLNRRGLIASAVATAAAASLPARAFASVNLVRPDYRAIVDRARIEMERVSAKLWKRDKVGIVDFGLPSNEPRLFVVDLLAGNVRPYLVAHGSGSDPQHDGWLKSFSKVYGSKATSRGAYLSMEWYQGKYGSSMRLEGLDSDNDTALDRAIVVHEAWYSAPDMLAKWGKLGRSEGCFAVSPGMNKDMLYHLGGGRLIFADKITDRPIAPIMASQDPAQPALAQQGTAAPQAGQPSLAAGATPTPQTAADAQEFKQIWQTFTDN